MINLEQVMKTYRTAAQWLGLLQQRSNFKGTNVEFCQHHNVSITTYYKQRALQAENQQKTTLPKRATSSRFIQLKQTTTDVCEHGGLAKATRAPFAAPKNVPSPSPAAITDAKSVAIVHCGKCADITARASASESKAAIG